MSKIAMSFSTSGTVVDSFYLAASVMLMMAEGLSGNTDINSSQGLSTAAASTIKSKIDAMFTSNNWSSIKAVKHSTNRLGSYFSSYVTKTSLTLTASSSATSFTGVTFSSLKTLLTGAGTGSQNYWIACMSQIIPYINGKISLMSDTEYSSLCNAVINAGGFSAYTKTNEPIQ